MLHPYSHSKPLALPPPTPLLLPDLVNEQSADSKIVALPYVNNYCCFSSHVVVVVVVVFPVAENVCPYFQKA